MLRKIDCVMIKVADLERAVACYRDVFGLRPLWRDAESVGLVFSGSDAEIVLHSIAAIPAQVDVNYLVDDVARAVCDFEAKGCRTLAGPFPIAIGKCAVIRDPFGTPMTLVDMTSGPRAANFK